MSINRWPISAIKSTYRIQIEQKFSLEKHKSKKNSHFYITSENPSVVNSENLLIQKTCSVTHFPKYYENNKAKKRWGNIQVTGRINIKS